MDRYVIFDVDHTLIDGHSLFYFLTGLLPQETADTFSIELPPCDSKDWVRFRRKLMVAYSYWVDEITRLEDSDHPLGIFRPGLFSVMRRLLDLQKRGLITAVHLYSNNSYPPTLYFIRDVIHSAIRSDTLIHMTIDWTHPLRVKERLIRLPDTYIGKSWETMREICEVSPHQVYYFDDLLHTDLSSVLGDQYYHVPKYEFRASFDRLIEIHRKILIRTMVPLYQYLQTIIHLFTTSHDKYEFNYRMSALENIYVLLKYKIGLTVSCSTLPQKEEGILRMEQCLDRIEQENRTIHMIGT
jgi:hypothetical protein